MIVIAGKNDIAVHGLELALKKYKLDDIVVVVNGNDDGVDGWQRSLLKRAKESNVSVKSLKEVYDLEISLFLSLEFDKIVNPERFKTENLFNIHFSLLPKYKGMYTSVWPIINGEQESGVTLHRIDSGIDTGEIVDQKAFYLSENDRSQDCYRKYIKSSIELLDEWFEKLDSNEISSVKQAAEKATYYSAKTIDFKTIQVDFNQTAWQVQRQVYSFSFRPYQLLSFNGRKITDVRITSIRNGAKPGTLLKSYDKYSLLATIDFDIEVYFDDLEGVLKEIPKISLSDFKVCVFNTLGVGDKNDKGWSLIIVAAYYGRRDLIEILLDMGADINDRNYKGTSVLMYAKDYSLENEDPDFFYWLIGKGADLEIKDYSGKSVLDYISEEEKKFLGV